MRPDGMALYGRICGWTLARAHARSGDRVAIAAYLGSSDRFDRAILAFSEDYGSRTSATTRPSGRRRRAGASSPTQVCDREQVLAHT
jgi:sugar/nucleoside kinase (ribokinase family)